MAPTSARDPKHGKGAQHTPLSDCSTEITLPWGWICTLGVSLAAADVNRDGHLDLLAPNFKVSGKMSVLIGDGGGGFFPFAQYRTGTSPQQVITADFNEDGQVDVATSNVNVFLGQGDGFFLPEPEMSLYAQYSVTSGDFDGDGHLDL